MNFQPKTGQACSCRRGQERDNCPQCEGTGQRIDFRAIRALTLAPPESVADQAARQARETSQANQRAQRQTVQDRAAAPLVGTRGDLGQSDMMGGSDLWGNAQ